MGDIISQNTEQARVIVYRADLDKYLRMIQKAQETTDKAQRIMDAADIVCTIIDYKRPVVGITNDVLQMTIGRKLNARANALEELEDAFTRYKDNIQDGSALAYEITFEIAWCNYGVIRGWIPVGPPSGTALKHA